MKYTGNFFEKIRLRVDAIRYGLRSFMTEYNANIRLYENPPRAIGLADFMSEEEREDASEQEYCK